MILSGHSPRHSPLVRARKRKTTDRNDKGHRPLSGTGSVGEELQQLAKERTIHTDPGETRRRRTIRLVRDNPRGCWGFTLQTYGIRHKQTGEVEAMTYVDYVDMRSPACIAGMRKGDVLLSVNGESVEGLNHQSLVAKIQHCQDVLRLVVLFEDCCRKVELYERFIRLKRIVAKKKVELAQLEYEEKVLCSGGLLSPVGFSRDSMRSSVSSDWDRYSLVLGPTSPGSASPSPGPSPRGQRYPSGPQDPRAHNGPVAFFPGASSGHPSGDDAQVGETDGFVQSPVKIVVEEEEPPLSDSSPELGRRISREQEDKEEEKEEEKVKEKEEKEEELFSSSSSSDDDSSSDSEAQPPPVCRMRSNSTILNEMRLKLLVDIVCHEATAAAGLLGQHVEEEEEEDMMNADFDPWELSDSEVIVEVEDEEVLREGEMKEEKKKEEEEEGAAEEREDLKNKEEEAAVSSARFCQGVRVNDSDQITRL